MKAMILTTIAALGATAVLAQSDAPEDDVAMRPQESKISELADTAEFGGDGYTSTDGEALYQSLCAGCHMPDGGGAVGAGQYPALSGNEKLEFASYPVYVIVNGQKAMPNLGELLDDEQVVAITTYIQTHLGNDYEPDATVETVAEARPADPADIDTEEHE